MKGLFPVPSGWKVDSDLCACMRWVSEYPFFLEPLGWLLESTPTETHSSTRGFQCTHGLPQHNLEGHDWQACPIWTRMVFSCRTSGKVKWWNGPSILCIPGVWFSFPVVIWTFFSSCGWTPATTVAGVQPQLPHQFRAFLTAFRDVNVS